MTTDDGAAEVDFSALSGPFEQDGIAVQVMIYRAKDSADEWQLELMIDDEDSIVGRIRFRPPRKPMRSSSSWWRRRAWRRSSALPRKPCSSGCSPRAAGSRACPDTGSFGAGESYPTSTEGDSNVGEQVEGEGSPDLAAANDSYEAAAFAEKYGLPLSEAGTIIKRFGPSRRKLDAHMASFNA